MIYRLAPPTVAKAEEVRDTARTQRAGQWEAARQLISQAATLAATR